MTKRAKLLCGFDFVFSNLFFVHNSFIGNESCREAVATGEQQPHTSMN